MEARGERHRRRNLEISFPYWKLKKKKNCVFKSVLSTTFVLRQKDPAKSIFSHVAQNRNLLFHSTENCEPFKNGGQGTIGTDSVQFSHLLVSDTLQPHELQHARLPSPSPTPGVYSNSSPLSQ